MKKKLKMIILEFLSKLKLPQKLKEKIDEALLVLHMENITNYTGSLAYVLNKEALLDYFKSYKEILNKYKLKDPKLTKAIGKFSRRHDPFKSLDSSVKEIARLNKIIDATKSQSDHIDIPKAYELLNKILTFAYTIRDCVSVKYKKELQLSTWYILDKNKTKCVVESLKNVNEDLVENHYKSVALKDLATYGSYNLCGSFYEESLLFTLNNIKELWKNKNHSIQINPNYNLIADENFSKFEIGNCETLDKLLYV